MHISIEYFITTSFLTFSVPLGHYEMCAQHTYSMLLFMNVHVTQPIGMHV